MRNVRFVVHLSMPESMERWRMEAGQTGRGGKRGHAVLITHLPNEACEKDMKARLSRSPRCAEDVCPYGKDGLCDFGRLHKHIRALDSVEEEALSVIKALDAVICSHKLNGHPVTISTHPRNEQATEKALYRLSCLGLFHDFKKDYKGGETIFHIRGLNLRISEPLLMEGFYKHLRDHDLSSEKDIITKGNNGPGHYNRIIKRINEKYGERIKEKILTAKGEKKITALGDYPVLSHRITRLIPAMLHPVYQSIKRIRIKKAWNMKEFVRKDGCRGAAFLRKFQVVDEDWLCRRCHFCLPDLSFPGRETYPPTMTPVLEELSVSMEKKLAGRAPLDLISLNRFADYFANFPENIYIRASHRLENYPDDLNALYLALTFSPEHAKWSEAGELMRRAVKSIDFPRIIRFYEDAPGHIMVKLALLDIMDDEFGNLNFPGGEEWLFLKAVELMPDRSRTDTLGARLIMNALESADLSAHKKKLTRFSEEI